MKRVIYLITVLLYSSCNYLNPIELIRNDDDIHLYDYYVDEFGNEGIVTYISTDSTDVMVVSADEGYVSWGPVDCRIYTKKENLLGSELSMVMLQNAIFLNINRFPAFKWCNDKNSGKPLNVASWMLPSEWEMRYMIAGAQCDLASLNEALINIGGTPIDADELYWTATEDNSQIISDDYKKYGADFSPEMRAVCMTPMRTSREKMIYWIKSNRHRVRAVKYIRLKGRD